MKQALTEAQVRRAVSAACAIGIGSRESDLSPHVVVDDLIGLDPYKRYMRCPSPETLAAYAEDALPLNQALAVAAHERDCPICRSDVRDLQSLVRQEVAQILAATPAWTSPFVGRDDVRASLEQTLSEGNTSLLTVAARPGTGKTRLLLETAVEHAYLFSDGVWYLPSPRGSGAQYVASEIARAANVPLQAQEPAVGQLQDFFADKRALLVLDDLSTEPEVVSLVDDLREAAPDLCLLASGGTALGMTGERELRLPPLQTPRSTGGSPHDLESMQLFVEHVRTFDPSYEPGGADADDVMEICRRTAGMPLGVELAAARMRDMEPREIARRMEQSVAPVDDPTASLGGLVEWSVEMLALDERKFLAGLTVFPDTFRPDQAAAICSAPRAELMLERLHQHALLQMVESAGTPRYRLLRPVREYARQVSPGESERMRLSHRRYFLGFASERAQELRGQSQVEAVAELSADLHNIRAGMDNATEDGDAQAIGDFSLGLQEFLLIQGLWDESEGRLRTGLEAFRKSGDEKGAVRAEIALGRCLVRKGRLEEAAGLFRSAGNTAERLNEPVLRAESSYGLGNVSQFAGRYEEATTRVREAMERYLDAKDRWGVADCEQSLGWLAWRQGDYRTARRLLEQSLATQRERGERYRVAHTLSCLANIAIEQARWDEARPQFEECLQICDEIGYARGIASALTNLGAIWQRSGDFARAVYCYERSIRQLTRIGDRRTLGQVVLKWAELALEEGDYVQAQERYEQALRTAHTAGDRQAEADAHEGLGRVAEEDGRPRDAAMHFRESLRLVHELGNVAGMAAAFCRCAGLAARLGRPEDAASILHVALPICSARQLGIGDVAGQLLKRLETQIGSERAEAIRRRATGMTMEETIALADSAMAG